MFSVVPIKNRAFSHSFVSPSCPQQTRPKLLGSELQKEIVTSCHAYLSENGFDVNRQVSMGAAVPSDDTEAESVRSSFKSDGLVLRWAKGRAGQSETHSEKDSPAPQSLPTQTYRE